jgi:hypothetical protein
MFLQRADDELDLAWWCYSFGLLFFIFFFTCAQPLAPGNFVTTAQLTLGGGFNQLLGEAVF